MNLPELLLKYRLHRDLAATALIDKLASAPPGTDPWTLDLTRAERQILGRTLAEDGEPPTRVEVERALAALVTERLRNHEQTITQEIASAEASGDGEAVSDWLALKCMVRRVTERLEA